jgi:hypothetical protein
MEMERFSLSMRYTNDADIFVIRLRYEIDE